MGQPYLFDNSPPLCHSEYAEIPPSQRGKCMIRLPLYN